MAEYVESGYYVDGYVEGDSPTGEFPWIYHRYSTKYPESGNRLELGGSYQFSSEPDGPDQRIFTLYFETMCYFTDASGAIDATVSPEINFAALENFYKTHRLWKSFLYDHPVYGQVTVKFSKPLEIPKGIMGGFGSLEPFTIELIEIP